MIGQRRSTNIMALIAYLPPPWST